VLRKLWDAVAPGGCHVVQDYDVGPAGAVPALDGHEAMMRTITDAFTAAGADVRIELFAQAGVGERTATTSPVAWRRSPAAAG
jgi:hypothetical protein